jgi:hypothetical protein
MNRQRVREIVREARARKLPERLRRPLGAATHAASVDVTFA